MLFCWGPRCSQLVWFSDTLQKQLAPEPFTPAATAAAGTEIVEVRLEFHFGFCRPTVCANHQHVLAPLPSLPLLPVIEAGCSI